MLQYIKQRITQKNLFLTSATIATAGAFLLIEHEYNYGFDLTFGHEWIGVILLTTSILIAAYSKHHKF